MVDLQAIRGRCEAATPGPWEWRVCGEDSRYIQAEQLGGVIELADDYPGYPECGEHLIMEMLGHDADFITHARQDIPALLAEVERLRATIAGTKAFCDVAKADGEHPEFDSGCRITAAAVLWMLGGATRDDGC